MKIKELLELCADKYCDISIYDRSTRKTESFICTQEVIEKYGCFPVTSWSLQKTYYLGTTTMAIGTETKLMVEKTEESMENYITRIVEICRDAKPNQKMMFDNFGKYVLHVGKDENYVADTDEYNMVDIAVYEKNGVKREGKSKDVLVGDEVGIHVLDLYRVLKGIADGTRKLSTL